MIGRQYEAQKKTVGAPVGNKNRCAQNEHIAKADGERVNRTAQAIAKEAGIMKAGSIALTGDELDRMDDKQLDEVIEN